VTDDVVDRGAAAVRIAAIAHSGGHRAAVKGHLTNEVVDLSGSHTGLDETGQFVENFSCQPPGLAHPLEAFRPVELDGPVAVDGLVAFDHLIFSHARHIAIAAPNCERPNA
jgi:hypothetical protein